MWLEMKRSAMMVRRAMRNADVIVRDFEGRNLAYAVKKHSNPNTPDQQTARGLLHKAGVTWRQMPAELRDAYVAYARRYGSKMGDQKYKNFSGWDVFHPAFRNRALLGEGPADRPVDAAPPGAVTAIVELPSDHPRTFSFKITHRSPTKGHFLLVRITEQTRHRAVAPVPHQARLIYGQCRESLVPLPPNHGTVTFAGTQYAVENGQRYGVEMRIVRVADGVHGRAFFRDSVRVGGGKGK